MKKQNEEWSLEDEENLKVKKISVIKKFGYKNYTGLFLSRNYRIWQVCWFNLSERIWNQKSVIIPLVILGFVSFIFLMPIAFTTSAGGNFSQVLLEIFNADLETIFANILAILTFAILTNPLTFILFGFIGGKIISEDIEYKSMEQYFLRLRRTDYLIGKLLAVFLSYFLTIYTIFLVFYYFLTSSFGYGLLDIEPLTVFVKITFFILVMTLVMSLFMLALSGATEKKNYATLIYIMLFLIVGDIFRIFAVILNNPSFYMFIPQEVISVVLFELIPLIPNIGSFGGFFGLSGGADTSITIIQGVTTLFLLSVGSIISVYYKIKNIWS